MIEADDAASATGAPRVIDVAFIKEHAYGFEDFAAYLRRSDWTTIECESGLPRTALEEAAAEYMRASKVIGIYGMGLTQHRRGVENVQMVCNLLLLRGNMGTPGAGICPVRGHSNVQGQRIVGITEKPDLAPLDELEARYDFKAPREKGFNTVETCQGVLDGSVKAFIGLGGNFLRAVPETGLVEEAWTDLALTVQIATKLNRSHLIHGKMAYLLPCRGRIEIDRQSSGPQSVTMEDSTGCMHGSRGVTEPASEYLLSEPAILGGIAKALLSANPHINWDRWIGNYGLIREEIAAIYPEIFHDFNARMWIPGGFRRPMPVSNRQWKTPNGKANFKTPSSFDEDPDVHTNDPSVLRLMTIRSDDQFNTTVYSVDDRLRGVYGTRRVLLMNALDIDRLGFKVGDEVDLSSVMRDSSSVHRVVKRLLVMNFDIPLGCAAGYFPECNPLIPLWHYAKESFVPAAKAIPIRLRAAESDVFYRSLALGAELKPREPESSLR